MREKKAISFRSFSSLFLPHTASFLLVADPILTFSFVRASARPFCHFTISTCALTTPKWNDKLRARNTMRTNEKKKMKWNECELAALKLIYNARMKRIDETQRLYLLVSFSFDLIFSQCFFYCRRCCCCCCCQWLVAVVKKKQSLSFSFGANDALSFHDKEKHLFVNAISLFRRQHEIKKRTTQSREKHDQEEKTEIHLISLLERRKKKKKKMLRFIVDQSRANAKMRRARFVCSCRTCLAFDDNIFRLAQNRLLARPKCALLLADHIMWKFIRCDARLSCSITMKKINRCL